MWNPDTDPGKYPGWFAARALRPLTTAEVAQARAIYTDAARAGKITATQADDFATLAAGGTRLPLPSNAGGKAKDPALASIHDALRAILQPGTRQALTAAAAATARSEAVVAVANAAATWTGADWVQRQIDAQAAKVAAAEMDARAALRAVLVDARRLQAGQVTDPQEAARIRAQAAALRREPLVRIVRHLLGDEAAGLGAIAPVVLIAAIGGVVLYLATLSAIKAICAAKQVSDVARAQADTAGKAIALQQEALKALPRNPDGSLTPEGVAAAAAISRTTADIQATSAAATASAVTSANAGGGPSPWFVIGGLAVVGGLAAWWWWNRRRAALAGV